MNNRADKTSKTKKPSNDTRDTRYVALLRGINIGGRNLMAMPKLQSSFEKAGMQDVSTYINTGNVLFRKAKLSPSAIVAKLEEAIRQDFALDIKVLLRCYGDFKSLMDFLPVGWANNSDMKCDVMFLWEGIDDPAILADLVKDDKQVITSTSGKRPTKKGEEHLHYVPGAVIWQVNRNKISKCHSLQKLASNKLYKKMTVRNINTIRKLYELMGNTL